ncbi:MAG TPA: ABC transporter permease [Nitrososphaera sp.]|nr:ABC transporter permease [Nitrososphaera sp.]
MLQQAGKTLDVKDGRAPDFSNLANATLFLAVFLGIWQLVTLLGIYPRSLLPSPADVAVTMAGLVVNGSLALGFGMTIMRLIAGFAISIILGGAMGLLMMKFPGFGKTMSSFGIGLLTFPSIAWVPFAIFIVGASDSGILFVVVMASVFSIMVSTYGAMRNIPPLYIRSARNMGATGLSLFRHVMIPAATPSLIMGLRQGWSFAWHALIGAEMLIYINYGLGHILYFGRQFSDMSIIIATMITIFAIGLAFDRLIFLRLEDRVRRRWGLDQHSE